MSLNPLTVNPEDTIGDALKIMKDYSIKRLPVLYKNKVVGIVTKQDLLKASPSSATSLSVWEINYLFPSIKIKEVMTQDVIVVSANTFLEEVALIMKEKGFGSLPVVEDGELVGIITENDVFKAFIDILGFNFPGVRIALRVHDHVGVLSEITQVISSMKINIISVTITRTKNGDINIVLRLDAKDLKAVSEALQEKNFEIVQ
jgi:acetoin utilization protein AcuB